jgi:uncharacterized protein (TIGR02271 family)
MRHTALSQHQNASLPESMADVRGFDVRTRDGDEKVGKVDDLVFTTEGQLRYLGIDMGGFFNTKHVLLPIGAAQVDRQDNVVWVSMTTDQFKNLPDYSGNTSDITVEYENDVALPHSARVGKTELYDQGRFYANRGGEAAREARLILSEEQLRVGKRQVQAGEVGLRKTVETEHVRESVPLIREEVTIERRPVSDVNASPNVEITEDQIRIPVMAEEAVVEKRVVAKEEVVARKEARTENQTVEADLRRERLEVDRSAETLRSSGTADRELGTSSGGQGLGDKLRNAADNLKDRVDGNPASRPGRDATDSRI